MASLQDRSSEVESRRRLVVTVDGSSVTTEGLTPKAAGPGSELSLSPTNMYNIHVSVLEGDYTDHVGQVWSQDKVYFRGPGPIKGPGSTKRSAQGTGGNLFNETIRKVYLRCCGLGEQDEVWFYGYGRGAYIVRAVASMLHHLGAPLTSTLTNEEWGKLLYEYTELQKMSPGASTWNHFRRDRQKAIPKIRFIGVIDTVKAVADDRYDVAPNKSTWHIRHALALHEDRKAFAPEYYWSTESELQEMNASGRSLIQAWFIGTHADFGGSADRAGLALYPLQWMLLESRKLGLGLAFRKNAPNGLRFKDPLHLVLSPDMKLWPYKAANGLQTEMQDLAPVHADSSEAGRYSVIISRNRLPRWEREIRRPFDVEKNKSTGLKHSSLRGYSNSTPLGTIIHPSVYCLLHRNTSIAMDSTQGALTQQLLEKSTMMLGEIPLTINGVSDTIPNPGFWAGDGAEESSGDLPPLRILVCGPTGVGKSTLINRVFGIDIATTVSHESKGIHDVNKEIRFEGRPELIFHDSMGFEEGSSYELEKVQEFVLERSRTTELDKQIHVIWFCVKTGNPRLVQESTKRFFQTMSECERHIPVLVVATQSLAYRNQQYGELVFSPGARDDKELYIKEAQRRLDEWTDRLQERMMDPEFAKVERVVRIDRDDSGSIKDLTVASSLLLQDERLQYTFVSAQMASPDMKLKMAIAETQRQYKRAVSSAAGTAILPFGMTGSRQGSQDRIGRTIIGCFGIKGLTARKLLKVMRETLKDKLSQGLIVTFGELMSWAGVICLFFIILAPLVLVTTAATAAVSVPETAQKYLCTACDITLILATSFRVASNNKRIQPLMEDVEVAAAIFKPYADQVHAELRGLVPRGAPFKAFKIDNIQIQYDEILTRYWKKMSGECGKGANKGSLNSRAPLPLAPSQRKPRLMEGQLSTDNPFADPPLAGTGLQRSESIASRTSGVSKVSRRWSRFSRRNSQASLISVKNFV